MASDQGSRTSYVEPSTRTSEATFRNRRAERTAVQESNPGGYGSGPSQAGLPSCREPGATASSWLSSSLRDRCSPLLSRFRRHARDERERSPGRWGNTDRSSSSPDDDRDDEEEEEKEEGAVGLGAVGSGSSSRLEDEVRPELSDEFSPRRRVGVCASSAFARSLFSGVEKQVDEQKETALSSKDQEKLRKIKERWDL